MASVIDEIEEEAFSKTADEVDYHDFYKYRISYITDKELRLLFMFVTGLTDNFEDIEKELKKCKKEFLNLFDDILQHKFDTKTFEVFDPTVDAIHRNLRPKISLVGFSGVGKTTITKLIKAEEIPMQHIPTITGNIATIKIGKLHFHLWDFAGQEQFSYLWSNFIKGSDAVLLITDSTLENVEKSKFFLELIKEQAPDAHSAAIANKQDLEQAKHPEQIEDILGLKAYSMIAIDPDNRDKMIKIIADVLEMNTQISPLLKPLLDRDEKMREAQQALENADFARAANLFEEISDLCIDLGDDSLSQEFYQKSRKIKAQLSGIKKEAKEEVKEEAEEAVEEKKVEKEKELVEDKKVEIKAEPKEKIEPEVSKKKELDEKEIESEEIEQKKPEEKEKIEDLTRPKVKPLPTTEKDEKPEGPKPPSESTIEPESTAKFTSDQKPEPITEKEPEPSPPQSTVSDSDLGLKLNPEDFMIKQRPKKVGAVPKDAKKQLKTSAYGHVKNPQSSAPKAQKIAEKKPKAEQPVEIKPNEKPHQKEVSKSELTPPPKEETGTEPISQPEADIQPKGETEPSSSVTAPSIPTKTSKEQKEELKKELMDLKIKKAKISKMALDFEMQELSGEITAEELQEKTSRLDAMEKNIKSQIKELEDILKN